MPNRYSAVVACCILSTLAAAPATRPTTRVTVVRVACVGDSITYGSGIADRNHDSYPAQLQRLLGPGYAVTNYGVGGATLLSAGDKPYVKQPAYAAALADRPDVVVIALGTNDTKPPNWAKHARFAADYAGLVAAFRRSNPAARVYLCQPPPAFRGRWGIRESIIKADVCPAVARAAHAAHATGVIDLHRALAGDKALFPDTISSQHSRGRQDRRRRCPGHSVKVKEGRTDR